MIVYSLPDRSPRTRVRIWALAVCLWGSAVHAQGTQGVAASPGSPGSPPGAPGTPGARRPAPRVRLSDFRGEVRVKRAAPDDKDFQPVGAAGPLGRRDEIETRAGVAEIILDPGRVVELAPGSLMAIIANPSGADAFLARGSLRVRAGDGQAQPRPLQLATGAGRLTLRSRDARVRVSGDAPAVTLAVSLYDGSATLAGRTPGAQAVALRAGQAGQVSAAGAAAPPQPLLPEPAWAVPDGLYLRGDAPPLVVLRWQAVPGAARYRVEISRTDGHPHESLEVDGTSVEVRDLPLGSYLGRVAALSSDNVQGALNAPRRILVAGMAGLGPTGVAVLQGTLPRVQPPPGLSAELRADGEAVPDLGLGPGPHRLQVTIAGLIAEVAVTVPPPGGAPPLLTRDPDAAPLVRRASPPAPAWTRPRPAGAPGLAGQLDPAGPPDRPDLSRPSFLGTGAGAGRGAVAEPETGLVMQAPDEPLWLRVPARTAGPGGARRAPLPVPVDDVALGGPGERTGFIRSPWAGRLAQVRLESTGQGWARLAVQGRFTLKSGLGADVSFSALRAALLLDGAPQGAGVPGSTGLGHLEIGLRTPALRRPAWALQGVVGVVAPLGTSALATYLPESSGAPVALADGWRVTGAVLVGLNLRRLALHTQQGVSVRVTGGALPGYEGGVALHAGVTPYLRVIALLQWSVNLLGVKIDAGDSTPDAGGAVGGGLEGQIPGATGPGRVRLCLLGRAGIGNAGAALYGRGSVGLQAGYAF